MPRGVPGSGKRASPGTAKAVEFIASSSEGNRDQGRREVFMLAVRFGLSREDLDRIGCQVAGVAALETNWHAEEGVVLAEMLASRNGHSLLEVAEAASAAAWENVAAEFGRMCPGFVARLVKGRVQVLEA